MPEPTPKDPIVDKQITALTGIHRKQAVRRGQCPLCKQPADSFRDEASRQEYLISGICQGCQDEFFA